MGLQKLEVVFDSPGVPVDQVCSIVLNAMKVRGILPPDVYLYGERNTPEELIGKVKELKRNYIQVDAGAFSFSYVSVRAFSHDLLEIRQADHSSSISWDDWVSAFSMSAAFVQGWVSDIEYVRWQNAEDPLEYEAAGKSTIGLAVKSNGLPPPLEKTIIDITGNPSRRVIRAGYVEGVGGIMWLSPKFFQKVRVDSRERLRSLDWLKVDFIERELLRLEVKSGVFVDSSTTELQKDLRSILFGQKGESRGQQ